MAGRKVKAPAKRKAVKPGTAPGRGRKAPGSRAQARFVKTQEQSEGVSQLISFGTAQRVIAKLLHIPIRTLERHFKDELALGYDMVRARVGKSIVKMALDGDKTMMIFFAKSQMGWHDTSRVGFMGVNNEPVAVPASNLFTVNITGLNDGD